MTLPYITLCYQKGDPLTYKEAKLCKHKKKWDLVELPKGRKATPNKWVYKIKIVDGKPKYKTRLIVGREEKEHSKCFKTTYELYILNERPWESLAYSWYVKKKGYATRYFAFIPRKLH